MISAGPVNVHVTFSSHVFSQLLSDAGSAETYPIEAGQIRKGGLMMIKGQPCKVSEVSTSKTGKHGSAKCNFTAYNIFNNKKLEDMLPSTHGTTAPNISRIEYTLVDINDEDFMTLMTESGETREDLKLPEFPETYAKELREEFAKGKQLVVTVLKAVGQEQVMSHKVDAE
jgi:translation initiation factor 5A